MFKRLQSMPLSFSMYIYVHVYGMHMNMRMCICKISRKHWDQVSGDESNTVK